MTPTCTGSTRELRLYSPTFWKLYLKSDCLAVAWVSRLWPTQTPDKSVQIPAGQDAVLGMTFTGPAPLAKVRGLTHPALTAL